MSLPKLDVPLYKLITPSDKKEITYRPFLVKEEKILYMAYESKDSDEIKMAIKQVINNCIVGGYDVDNAPTFDIEWILINLRIRSVGGKIENNLICNNTIDGKEVCNTPFKVEIDLNEIKINNEEDKNYSKKTTIELDPNKKMGVILRYPRFSFVKNINTEGFDYDLLKEVVQSIYDKTTTYLLEEQPNEDIETFFDSLNKEQYDKIIQFIKDIPKFSIEKYHKCPKCGFNHVIKSDDVLDFFT
jgi:hypothetical protein